jgi:hypothetical protein
MSDFYLTLPSNSSMSFYPENTLSSFTTRLPNSIDLDGDWEVGLVEIQYPHNWYNVPMELSPRTLAITSHGVRTMVAIHPGYYPSMESLTRAVENVINEEVDPLGKLSYNPITGKVKGKFQVDMTIQTPPHLQKMLGLDSENWTVSAGRMWKALEVADLDPIDSLYLYCDVIEPRVVGDSLVPLLRIVPVEGEHNDLVTRIYENVHYVRLQRKSFQTLEINIRDRTGKKVPFERGTLNVTLHFRQRKRHSTL